MMLTIRPLTVKENGVIHRLLTVPLAHTTREKAEASHWIWFSDGKGTYTLRPLGILNRLFGVTLFTRS